MSWIFIILGIIVVILIFILYNYSATTYLVQTAFLNNSNPAITIGGKNPYSPNFTLNCWFYLTDMSGIVQNQPYYIFSRKSYGDIYIINKNNNLSMEMEMKPTTESRPVTTLKPITTLKPVTTLNPVPEIDHYKPYIIMDNIPITEWIYITFTVYSNIVDVYINGKLVRSITHKTSASNSLSNQIGVGMNMDLSKNTLYDGVVSQLVYYPINYSPEDAYNSYVNSGKSSTTIKDVLTKYTVGLSLTKNGTVTQTQTIL